MSASLEGEFWIIAVKRKMQAHLGQCTEFPWWSHYLLICWTPAENFQRHFPSKSKENSTRKVKMADFCRPFLEITLTVTRLQQTSGIFQQEEASWWNTEKKMTAPSRRAVVLLCFSISKRDIFICNLCSTGLVGVIPLDLVHLLGEKRNINMPSSRSSLPGRITFKPHRSHLCYRAPPSLYLPHTLHTFEPIFWNCAYRRLKFII